MELPVSADNSPAKAAEAHGSNEEGPRCGGCVPVVPMLVATVVCAQAAYRARRAPWDLAFVLFAYSSLALLFWCLRRYERLAGSQEDRDDGERRRLKMAVWALSVALSAAFAWRVAAVMPTPLKVAVWGITLAVAFAGFYGLFVYEPSADYSELDTCEVASCKPENIV